MAEDHPEAMFRFLITLRLDLFFSNEYRILGFVQNTEHGGQFFELAPTGRRLRILSGEIQRLANIRHPGGHGLVQDGAPAPVPELKHGHPFYLLSGPRP